MGELKKWIPKRNPRRPRFWPADPEKLAASFKDIIAGRLRDPELIRDVLEQGRAFFGPFGYLQILYVRALHAFTHGWPPNRRRG